MSKYAIAYQDYDHNGGWGATYWTTRVGNTDNYTADKNDATLFADRVAAKCLMRTLGLDDHDHIVVQF